LNSHRDEYDVVSGVFVVDGGQAVGADNEFLDGVKSILVVGGPEWKMFSGVFGSKRR
jgi:hypothetical protein